MRNLLHSIKLFFIGLKNVYEYFPIIYKDRDWDFSFYEKLMLFKLKRMYKCLNKKRWPCDCDFEKNHSLKALRICIKILERRKNDFYFDLIKDLVDQDMAFIEVGNGYRLSPDYQISSNMEKYNRVKNDSWAIEKRDYKLYHKLILEYSEYWWD
jgi:hypothetical protein